jgi:hypothetical protein
MILSFDKKFLFIKNTKVAGTSIEIALSKALSSEKDIITPISLEDEMIRLKEGGLSSQNWAYTTNNKISQLKNYGRLIKFYIKNYNNLIDYSDEISCRKLIQFKIAYLKKIGII